MGRHCSLFCCGTHGQAPWPASAVFILAHSTPASASGMLSCLCNMRFPNWQHDPGAAAAAPASDSTGARLAPRTAHSFSRPGACIIICHIHMCVCLADLWLAKFVKQIEKMQEQEPGAAGRSNQKAVLYKRREATARHGHARGAAETMHAACRMRSVGSLKSPAGSLGR